MKGASLSRRARTNLKSAFSRGPNCPITSTGSVAGLSRSHFKFNPSSSTFPIQNVKRRVKRKAALQVVQGTLPVRILAVLRLQLELRETSEDLIISVNSVSTQYLTGINWYQLQIA